MRSRSSASKKGKVDSSKVISQKIASRQSQGGSLSPKPTGRAETSLPTYPDLLAHWEWPPEPSESGSETQE